MLSSTEIEELTNKTAEATTALVKEHPVIASTFGSIPGPKQTGISTTENKISELLPQNE